MNLESVETLESEETLETAPNWITSSSKTSPRDPLVSPDPQDKMQQEVRPGQKETGVLQDLWDCQVKKESQDRLDPLAAQETRVTVVQLVRWDFRESKETPACLECLAAQDPRVTRVTLESLVLDLPDHLDSQE